MEFAEIYDTLQRMNCEVIALSSDSFDSCRDLRTRIRLPYRVYSDPECRVIKSLGIFHDGEPKNRQIARPTVYILDSKRTITYRYVGEGSRDRPVTADIPSLIEAR